MKKMLPLLIITIVFLSCDKNDDDIVIGNNSLADDLKQVIQEEGVQALQTCCIGCSCAQTIGWGTDFSFPGDNFVRIRDTNYNLNELKQFKIETVSETNETEVRMVLFFPRRVPININ